MQQQQPKRTYAKRKKVRSSTVTQTPADKTGEPSLKKVKRASNRKKADATLAREYNVESVLLAWDDTTDYGISFRNMSIEEQQKEVINLNKGAAKGLKGMIKNKLLVVHFKSLVVDKLKEHLGLSRVLPSDMFHAAPNKVNLVTADPSFISVGEWVEVDADRTPGYNSEGGIAVVISAHDALVDVK
jgi:hypothetical protein